MKVIFTNAFEKDISRLDGKISSDVISVIEELKNAASLSAVANIKKMKGSHNAFRIKIKNFRLGFFLEKDTILISRVLNRKDIYKYFP